MSRERDHAMELRHAVGRAEYGRMTTDGLREAFLVDSLFRPGLINLVHWESDRTIIGSAVPHFTPLVLEAGEGLAADSFCERRELGVINLGKPGSISLDGKEYRLDRLDALYVGRGTREVTFSSDDPGHPARYYLVSYPAHATHPTTLIRPEDAERIELGDQETANRRTIHQMIHEGSVRSSQLVMGFTRLAPGSVWNTMPPHTHARRSEVYLYFDLAANDAVFHLMGPGDQTRHMLVRDGQAALSPSWSIHAGCGTRSYSFVWAMGGENQRFDDMDGIQVPDLC